MLKKYFYKIALAMGVFTLISISTASAQIKFGLKAGVDVAENKISKDILNAHNRVGFQVGPTVQFKLPLIGLGVDAGLLYGYKDYKLKVEQDNLEAELSNYHYLMVPVQLKQTFSVLGLMGIYVKGGPYGEFKLGGGDFKFNSESLDKIKSKSFGVGLDFGLGVELAKKVEVGMNYRFKLTDNYKDSKIAFSDFTARKDRTWNVSLTYLF